MLQMVRENPFTSMFVVFGFVGIIFCDLVAWWLTNQERQAHNVRARAPLTQQIEERLWMRTTRFAGATVIGTGLTLFIFGVNSEGILGAVSGSFISILLRFAMQASEWNS